MTCARCRPAAPPSGAAERRRAKTDAEDAQAIARETLAHPDLPPAGKQHTPDPDWEELVALRNQRRSLIAQRRRLLNEAESVLVGLPLVVRAVLPATSQVRPRLRALAQGAADQLQLTGADRVHLAWLAASTDDIGRLDQRIRQLDERIPAVLARHCCTLTEEVGIAAVGAMELLVEVGDPTRFATEARFARWCGAAPVAVSSGEGDGEPERHRLDLGTLLPARQGLPGRQARRAQDGPRSPPRPQAAARQRRHPAHVGRPPTAKVSHPEPLQPDNPKGRLTKEPRVDDRDLP
jgi:transposase